MRRCEQQANEAARGFANPVHPGRGQRVEHRDDLRADRIRRVVVFRLRLAGEAAAQKRDGKSDASPRSPAPIGSRTTRYARSHASSALAFCHPRATGNRRSRSGSTRLPARQCAAWNPPMASARSRHGNWRGHADARRNRDRVLRPTSSWLGPRDPLIRAAPLPCRGQAGPGGLQVSLHLPNHRRLSTAPRWCLIVLPQHFIWGN
jgi:hypothetical protein